jgi:hypothetical protein
MKHPIRRYRRLPAILVKGAILVEDLVVALTTLNTLVFNLIGGCIVKAARVSLAKIKDLAHGTVERFIVWRLRRWTSICHQICWEAATLEF